MVVAVGYHIHTGNLVLNNSVTNDRKNLKLKAIGPDNAHLIEEFFEEIKTKIIETIDCFCVLMDYQYKNNFRKKFIENSKTQNTIKNVRIICVRESQLLSALKDLSFTPQINDLLLVFDCRSDKIHCMLWKYTEEKEWKYKKGMSKEKTSKGLDKSPHADDLKKLKEVMLPRFLPKTPYIFVFHECFVKEKKFKNVFLNFKKIQFEKHYDWARWALIYARSFLKEKGFLKCMSDKVLDKKLNVKMSHKNIFDIPVSQTLPFKKTAERTCNKNDVINIFDHEILIETLYSDARKISISLDIDINGIHTIKIINLENTIGTYIYAEIKKEIYVMPKKLADYNPDIHAVGIDFGTTECCAAVIRKNGPDFVVLDQVSGLRTMPSYVAFDEREPKCGQIVIDRMRYKSEYTVYDSKRIIGRKNDEIVIDSLWPFKLIETSNNVLIEMETNTGKDTKAPVGICATLLKHIKVTVEIYEGKALSEAVITIPSAFSEKQKDATKIAAEMAGWKIIHFIPEPVAAAIAYFSEIDVPNDSNILICDCGGGTIDICIAKFCNNKIEILSCDGDFYLGGRDFDKLLFNHFSAILKQKYDIDVMKSPKKYILKRKCQEIKHKLSVANEDWLDVDEFDQAMDGIIEITKEEFEEMSSNLIVKMKDVILRAVTKAYIPKSFINYVFQVGGGCRMPMIKEMLKNMFPDAKHECNLYPDWVVAHGAALYAYYLKSGEYEKSKTSWLNKIFN